MADKFDELFQLQGELNRKIGIDTPNLPEKNKPEWILNYCRALSQEIAELTDSVPWKWWAKYQTFDKQNARVEVVDMFHFLISLAQVLDMTADDVYNAYREKHKVNVERQNSGYSVKNEADSRHI
jgi:dimeric dUTPase (all-alpha-NTP-PPase superfamily)